MFSNPSSHIRKVGVGFILVFLLFFFNGLLNKPLLIEIKKAEINNLKKTNTTETSEKDKKISKVISDSILKQNLKDSIFKLENEKYLFLKPGSTPVDTRDGVERVLLLGDSQLEGLRSPVSSYCAKNGHVLLASAVYYGSSTKQWGSTDTLEYFLKLYKPSVVFFAIGLNELFVMDLDNRVTYIKNIIKKFEDYHVRYYWIGPSPWTKDKGIITTMRDAVGEYFFASHELDLERASDGRHPSKKASKIWFDKVAVSCTKKGVLDLSKHVDTLPKIKYDKTIIMNVNDSK